MTSPAKPSSPTAPSKGKASSTAPTVLRYVLGIDLGSTTTKAVVLDERGALLGRGITNTRSNYEVACAVAMTEALVRTRFGLIASELSRAGVPEEKAAPTLAALERGFRLEQYREQLAFLGQVLAEVSALARLEDVVTRIVRRMEEEAPSLFVEGAARKSDFFRDLAGSRYLALAEGEARRGAIPFERLAGFFDKAILRVENAPMEEGRFAAQVATASQRIEPPLPPLAAAVARATATVLQEVQSVGTGYGRQRLPFPKEQIRSEILCHGLGAHVMFPATRTVLDIGGQDTKAIQVDENGIVTSFQMNDRCAAGCGRYLGYIADEMNLGVHELGPLASASNRPVRISSTCTVFAGAELRERLSLGEKREDILAGLHRAIILRAMSLLARSGGVSSEFTFTGGVARNTAAVDALRRLVTENYGEMTMNVSADSIYTGALGAAHFALRDAVRAAAPLAG